jgi:hypothetical protein
MIALHIGRMKDEGEARPEHISFGKLNNVREAIEIAREARTILGGERDNARVPRDKARQQLREREDL